MTPDLSYYWEGAGEWCGDDIWDEEKKCCEERYMIINTIK